MSVSIVQQLTLAGSMDDLTVFDKPFKMFDIFKDSLMIQESVMATNPLDLHERTTIKSNPPKIWSVK